MSEFDKLKDDAEKYAQDHPEQVQKGEQAAEKKLGLPGQRVPVPASRTSPARTSGQNQSPDQPAGPWPGGSHDQGAGPRGEDQQNSGGGGGQ